jgi:hypothetical protein
VLGGDGELLSEFNIFKMGIVKSHPNRKNKSAARVGHQ